MLCDIKLYDDHQEEMPQNNTKMRLMTEDWKEMLVMKKVSALLLC